MAGTSYTRQSTLTDGDTITASLFNTEYNQLVSAFAYASTGTTGHQHDGGAGEGGNIHTIGDQDFNNKIVVDSSNNRWSVYVEVGGSAVEQVRIEDGVVYPVTDSDVDLGTNVLRFKDAYIDSLTATGNLTIGGNIDVDGTIEFDGLSGTGSVTVTDILDQDDMSGNSATALATQQSIKAYVDAQVTAQDLDLTDGSSSISIDLDSEALSVLGGTGIDSTASGNGVTLAIDSTVTTLTGSQTLTNKTLTSPDVNTPDIDGGTIDGTVIGGSSAAAGSFTTVGATGNITVGGTVDGRDVATDGTKLDGIEASATADQTASEIRTLVESASDSNVFTDADHSKLNAIEASADVTDTANVTAAGALMDSELTAIASVKALNQGVATTDSPTFAAVTVNGNVEFDGLSGTGSVTVTDILDQDDMSGNSATALATQQSIKAYVDAQQDTVDTLAEILALSNATGGSNIVFGDSSGATDDRLQFGASQDLSIYHDGSDSYIHETGTGSLNILGQGRITLKNSAGDETLADFLTNSRVDLYYDNAVKFSTTSGGISVTGEVAATSLDISGDIDVDGTTNLDVVDIDGAVDMASTALVTGVLTTTAATVFNGGFAAPNKSTILVPDGTGDNDWALQVSNLEATDDRSFGVKIKAGSTATDTPLFIQTHDGGETLFNLRGSGDLTVGGVVTANAGVVVDNITIDGNEIDVSSGNLTLDVAGDINLDADSGSINFKDGGVSFGSVFKSSSNMVVYSSISNGDMKFMGNDGGSNITALTLDMSDAGTAIFNHHIKLSATNRLFFDGGSNTYIQESASDDLRFFVGGSQAVRVRASGTDILGVVTADAITVDNITIDGNEIDVGSGDLTLDVAGKINLDHGSPEILLKDGGTHYASFISSNTDFVIQSIVSDKDMLFKGQDGSSTITALTLDMSLGGTAYFADDVRLTDNHAIRLGTDGDIVFYHDNSNGYLENGTGNFTLDVAGDITLDADGGDVRFKDGGTEFLQIFNNSTDAHIYNANQDKDILIQGNDGGSTVTAVQFDMSDAGTAIFNHDASFPDGAYVKMGAGADLSINSDGTNGRIFADNGNLTLDVAGDIILDADGGNLKFADGGIVKLDIYEYNSNLYLDNQVSDSDIIFQGVDGSTSISALTLDMSAAGAATFSSSVAANKLTILAADGVRPNDYVAAFQNQEATNSQSFGVSIAAGSTGSDIALNVVDHDASNVLLRVFGNGATTIGGVATFNSNVIVPNDSYFLFGDTTTSGIQGNSSSDFIKFYTSNIVQFQIASDGSLSTPTAGTSNVRFGVNAGNSIASGGNQNTVIGDEAGTAITTGDDNVAVGFSALDVLDTGQYNIAVGVGALSADTKGNRSVGVGLFALNEQNFTSSTDAYNVAMGFYAGRKITTGTENTLIGGLAGDALQDADRNTAVGYLALSSDTLGSNSVAIGRNALSTQNFTSATDTYNTAVGINAGNLVTTGIRNTFVGGLAGDGSDDGSDNTAVGKSALSANHGNANTAIGESSLANCTGTSNTAIGKDSGNLITSGTKNTIVGLYNGNQGGLDIRTSSNNIVLSDGDGNPVVHTNNEVYHLKLNDYGDSGTDHEYKTGFSGSSNFDNITINLVRISGGSTNNLISVRVRATQLPYGSAVCNTHEGMAVLRKDASGTTEAVGTMSVTSQVNLTNVGTLSWTSNDADDHTLVYTSNRSANYDSYKLEIEVHSTTGGFTITMQST